MRSFLLFWVLSWAVFPAFSQAIASKTYSFAQLPVVKQATYLERNLFEGTSRDFSHIIGQTFTIDAGQPAQPTQQLDEEIVLICKEGELTLTLGGKRNVLVPGTIVMIMPGDDFQIANKAAQPLTYYQIRYTSNEVPDLDLYRLTGQSFWVDWPSVPATTNQQGNSRRLIPYPTIMSKYVALETIQTDAGVANTPTHTHRAAEMILILDQPVEMNINGTVTNAQVGDFIFVESELPHSLRPISAKGCSYVSIQL